MSQPPVLSPSRIPMLTAERLSRTLCAASVCVCMLGLPTRSQAQAAPNEQPQEIGAPLAAPRAEIGLGSLLGETLQDFRRLPSEDALRWLVIGAFAASIGGSVDQPVSRTLSTSSRLRDLLDSGEIIGGARAQLGGALATYAIGRMSKSPRATRLGADLLKAQIISQSLTGAMKFSARRTRPDGTQFSFPSGHSSVTFASATVLQRHLGWKAGIPAYGVATYVAASRIQEKRHFLSDVAFGAAIGIVAGRTVTIGRGNGRFAIAPMPARGGGGMSFTWVGQR
jgi:membrane-associated phospholipid phosphatase